MALGLWIGLILCNVAWAVNPAISKLLIVEIGPEFTAWIKYASAFTVFSIAVAFGGRGGFRASFSRRDLLSLVAMGLATFFLSPLTQMAGLNASTAVANSLLIAFEPIFTALFGWLLLRERLGRAQFLGFGFALVGFSLISGMASSLVAGGGGYEVSMGDVALLLAVAAEGIYTVLAKGLLPRHSGRTIYGFAMGLGALLLSVVILTWKGLPPLHQLSVKGWIAVLWMGTLGTVVPYLFWLHALNRKLPIGSIVLTLFLQPVLGVLAGVVFLGEQATLLQLAGGALILASVGAQIWQESRAQGATPDESLARPAPLIQV